MSQIKKYILDVELNSNFTHRNKTIMFLFLKLFISSSVFLFRLNEFNIKISIILVLVISTMHSSYPHLRSLKISYKARLREFVFLNKRTYFNLLEKSKLILRWRVVLARDVTNAPLVYTYWFLPNIL